MSEVRGEQAATVDEPEYRGRPLASWIGQIRDKASGDERNALSMAIGVMSFATLARAAVVVLPKTDLWQCQNTDNGNLVYLPYKPQGPWDCTEYLRRDSIARMNRSTVPLELLRRLLSHDFAEDCQECGIGQSEAWGELRAILEGMVKT